jgi:preprotein translocase subunit SecG
MRVILLVLLILVSVSIIVLVLIQQRGGGAGAVFGGGGGDIYRTKRGVERIYHYLTIVLAVLFSVVSFSLIFVK